MELFFHKTANETVEEMISVRDGKKYLDHPNAFAHQQRFDPACRCNHSLARKNRKKQSTPKQDGLPKLRIAEERKVISRVAMPAWRIDRGQDPETLGNLRGALSVDSMAKLKSKGPGTEVAQQTRRIRVIGDAFFPTQ